MKSISRPHVPEFAHKTNSPSPEWLILCSQTRELLERPQSEWSKYVCYFFVEKQQMQDVRFHCPEVGFTLRPAALLGWWSSCCLAQTTTTRSTWSERRIKLRVTMENKPWPPTFPMVPGGERGWWASACVGALGLTWMSDGTMGLLSGDGGARHRRSHTNTHRHTQTHTHTRTSSIHLHW